MTFEPRSDDTSSSDDRESLIENLLEDEEPDKVTPLKAGKPLPDDPRILTSLLEEVKRVADLLEPLNGKFQLFAHIQDEYNIANEEGYEEELELHQMSMEEIMLKNHGISYPKIIEILLIAETKLSLINKYIKVNIKKVVGKAMNSQREVRLANALSASRILIVHIQILYQEILDKLGGRLQPPDSPQLESVVTAPEQSHPAPTDSEQPLVVLKGLNKQPIVLGKPKPKLNKKQYKVVKTMLDAGPDGLSEEDLVNKSGCGDARGILNRLIASDPDWKLVLQTPGKRFFTYHIGLKQLEDCSPE